MSFKHIIFSDDFQKIRLTPQKNLPDEKSLSDSKWYALKEIQHFKEDDGKLVCEKLAQSWEFMPGSHSPYSVKKPKNNKVIFFGGSFNPWHAGHEQCLKQLAMPDNLFIIPDNNPRKQSNLSSNICVWSRYQDLKAKVLSPVDIYPGFWTSQEANPTSSWLPQIKANHPELSLGLLIGFDSFMTIHNWIDAKKLMTNLSDLYIVSRLDKEIAKLNQINHFKEFYPHVNLNFLGHHQYEDLSSTQLRNHS